MRQGRNVRRHRQVQGLALVGLLLSLVLAAPLPTLVAFQRPVFAANCSTTRIMPLGDSITAGVGSGDQLSVAEYMTGYRQPLYVALQSGGYNVDFVGSQQGGQNEGLSFDTNHQGHPGWTAAQVSAKVHEWLTASPADIVLLHIGTNALTSSTTDVESILNEIDRYNTSVKVVLARIINRSSYSVYGKLTSDFNANLQKMMERRVTNGDDLRIVNMEPALTYPDDLADNLHPNEAGYHKMASVWYDALDDMITPCLSTSKPIPTITSNAPTSAIVDQLYTYDVSAVGSPSYALTTAPSGMTIDTTTGLISWRPTSAQQGTQSVTIQTSNVAGTNSQSFTITVSASRGCPTGMIAYWKFDETSGQRFDDFCKGSDGNDALCTRGCPTSGTGLVGSARVFDGTKNEVDVPADASFDWAATDSFSIELWMKAVAGSTCSGTGTSNNDVFIGRDDLNSGLSWSLGCLNSTGKAFFQLTDTSGNSATVEGSVINDGSWHHVVGVRDSTNGVNRLYVDGAEVGSVSKTYSAGFASALAPVTLGWLDYAWSTRYAFPGTLDEVAVFSRALTAAEVQQHRSRVLNGQGYCDNGSSSTPTPTSTPSTPTSAPTSTPTSTPATSTRIKTITFEDGSLTHTTSGVDSTVGTVSLESTAPIKGSYAARIGNAGTSYLREDFSGVNDLFVTFSLRLVTLPNGNARIALISANGTQVANLLVRSNGQLRLRNHTTTIGADSSALSVGTIYRIGLRQKVGTGSNGVIEAYLATGDTPFGSPFASSTAQTFTAQATQLTLGATTTTAINAVVDEVLLDAAGNATPTNTPTPTSTPTNTPTNTPTGPTSTPTNTPMPTNTPTATTNRLLNGGFELDNNNDGRPDNWTSSARALRSNLVVHGGSYAMRHYATDDAGHTIYQDVNNLTAGQSYMFEGWVNIPATSDTFTFTIDIRWRNASGTNLGMTQIVSYSAATSGWVQATANLAAPSGTSYAQVRMIASSLNATIYTDDFVLQ